MQSVWIVVSTIVAIGAAIFASGFMRKQVKRKIKTEQMTSVPKLELSSEGLRHALNMDASRYMPVSKEQIEYSTRRGLRKYCRDQELREEGIKRV